MLYLVVIKYGIMAKSTTPIWFSICIAGLIAGISTAIGIKYGIEPDETSARIFVLQSICEIYKENEKISNTCNWLLPLTIILSITLAIIVAFGEAARLGSWKIGLAIYGGGWVLGLVWLLSYLK